MKSLGNNSGRGSGWAGQAMFDGECALAKRRQTRFFEQVNKTLY
jgi:hypothetical protein